MATDRRTSKRPITAPERTRQTTTPARATTLATTATAAPTYPTSFAATFPRPETTTIAATHYHSTTPKWLIPAWATMPPPDTSPALANVTSFDESTSTEWQYSDESTSAASTTTTVDWEEVAIVDQLEQSRAEFFIDGTIPVGFPHTFAIILRLAAFNITRQLRELFEWRDNSKRPADVLQQSINHN